MKQCPYCGKEYPDNATACELDATPLEAKGTNAVLSPKVKVKLTGIDEMFADSSSISFWGLNARLLWGIIGVIACKHPTARKNARIYFFRQIAGILVIIIIFILILNGTRSK